MKKYYDYVYLADYVVTSYVSFMQKECISAVMHWCLMACVVPLHTCTHTRFEVSKNAWQRGVRSKVKSYKYRS